LRHRICENGRCKEPAPKPQPQPQPESDLRVPICVKGRCPCPAGQTASKGGCITPVNPVPPCQPGSMRNGVNCVANSSCPAGQVWNGASCVVSSPQCPLGQVWNGGFCQVDCSIVNANTASAILQVRSARRQRDDECRQDPSGTLCQQLDGQYQSALAEYRSLWAAAPPECRSTLPMPDTL
jgi:hypothetical protein